MYIYYICLIINNRIIEIFALYYIILYLRRINLIKCTHKRVKKIKYF